MAQKRQRFIGMQVLNNILHPTKSDISLSEKESNVVS